MEKEGGLFAIDREREEGVARPAAPISVAGVDIQHAVRLGLTLAGGDWPCYCHG